MAKLKNNSNKNLLVLFIILALIIGFSIGIIYNSSTTGKSIFDIFNLWKTQSLQNTFVPLDQNMGCNDSDGGVYKSSYGTCKILVAGSPTYYDKCIGPKNSSKQVNEYYCAKNENGSKECRSVILPCSLSCIRGACTDPQDTIEDHYDFTPHNFKSGEFMMWYVGPVRNYCEPYHDFDSSIVTLYYNSLFDKANQSIPSFTCVNPSIEVCGVTLNPKQAGFMYYSGNPKFPFSGNFTLQMNQTYENDGIYIKLLDISQEPNGIKRIKVNVSYSPLTYPFGQSGVC